MFIGDKPSKAFRPKTLKTLKAHKTHLPGVIRPREFEFDHIN